MTMTRGEFMKLALDQLLLSAMESGDDRLALEVIREAREWNTDATVDPTIEARVKALLPKTSGASPCTP